MSYDQYRPTGFRLLPPVVKNILIISGLFYLATLALGTSMNIDLADILGMHYFSAEKFRPYQIVSYMFMHGSFSHILFNMFAFWMFGYVLENVWGSKRFLTFFLITGMGAALIQMGVFFLQTQPVTKAVDAYTESPSYIKFRVLINSKNFPLTQETYNAYVAFEPTYKVQMKKADSLSRISYDLHLRANALTKLATQMPQRADTLKAKAVVLQKQGDYAQEQLNAVLKMANALSVDYIKQYKEDYLNSHLVVGASGAVFGILLAFGMMFPNTRIYIYFFIPLKAKWFVIIYGAIELVTGFVDLPGDNVAHFAHLGGMLFGLLLILWWRKKAKRREF